MSVLRRTILLTLTLLVLLSSVGLAVGMHLCGGELRDVAFFGDTAECPMEHEQKQKTPACHKPVESQKPDTSCCEDHNLVVERLDTLSDASDITLQKLQEVQFLVIVKVFVIKFFASETEQTPSYALYASPPLARDIPVLVQSFLL